MKTLRQKKSENGPSVTATLITTIHVGTEERTRTFGLMARTQVLAANPKGPEKADFTFVKPLSWNAKDVQLACILTRTHFRDVDIYRSGCGEEGKSK